MRPVAAAAAARSLHSVAHEDPDIQRQSTVYEVDPLNDPRWMPFLQGHSFASVFHTSGWLEALRRTYGYEPVAFTHSARGTELKDAIVFCRVKAG